MSTSLDRGDVRRRAVACGMALLLQAEEASTLPTGLLKQTPASGGSTQIAKEGFEAAAADWAAWMAERKNSTTFKVTLGGFLALGNSRTLALTGSTDYFLRQGPSAFNVLAAVNYGRSAPNGDAPSQVTVQNYQARVRYDYFFKGSLAGFVGLSARRDRFLGLDLRLNIDPGVAYYLIDEKDHRLWVEFGYDLQFDVRQQSLVDASRVDDDMSSDVKRNDLRHNARLFAGYVNQVVEAVKFNAGIEYLQNVQETNDAIANMDVGLTSQLSASFSIATTLTIKFDDEPLPGVGKTDIVSALNLVYTLDE